MTKERKENLYKYIKKIVGENPTNIIEEKGRLYAEVNDVLFECTPSGTVYVRWGTGHISKLEDKM